MAKHENRTDAAPPAPPWVPPGWYADPLGVGAARFWDGSRWSKRYRDAPPPEAMPSEPTGVPDGQDDSVERTAAQIPTPEKDRPDVSPSAARPVEVKGRNGTVSFDGRMITISRKGFLGRTSIGKGEKQIPLAHITAVRLKPAGPVMNGFIQFTLGGGIETRSHFGSQTSAAANDENSVIFTYSQRSEFEQLRDHIQAALLKMHDSSQPIVAEAPDIPTQIQKLSELHAAGVLTDNEFAAKKTELLERM